MFRKAQKPTSRAERVRQRRAREKAPARRRGPRRAEAVAAQASGGPVVVGRYGVIGGAVVQPTGRVRRQVRVPKGRHTELVAALPWVSLGWRWLSLALSAALVVVLLALWYAPVFRVEVPQVVGTHYLPAERVAERLGVVGRSVVALNPAQLAQQVEALPAIAHASVRVTFPNRVVVQVAERQPVAVWQQGRKVWWVDGEGIAFAPPVEKTPPHALVVQADTLPLDAVETRPGEMQMLSPAQIDALRTLAKHLPEGTPLVYSRRYGLGWQAPEGWRVFVGRELTQMNRRMALYQAIAQWLKSQGVQPALVNVASLRAPYYRMEP